MSKSEEIRNQRSEFIKKNGREPTIVIMAKRALQTVFDEMNPELGDKPVRLTGVSHLYGMRVIVADGGVDPDEVLVVRD